jgi:hypothetical protein
MGRDFDADGAAAVCAVPRAEAEGLLEELVDRNLLGQRVQGRYYFHDLIRRYASEKARAEEPPPWTGAVPEHRAAALARPRGRECLRGGSRWR